MADKTPIRGAYNGSSALTGLAEYASSDTVGIAFGGTGATSLADNGILIGNATSAIQTSGDLTFNGTTFATTAFTATGNVSLDGGTFVFNESGADKDFRVEGDTDANLFMADASTDRIGIGTATPSHLLDVEGVAHVATCIVTPKVCITSQYALPAADGSAGEILCTDGSGAIAFAEAASSGHTIADEGSALASRTCLNFVGSAVAATDNSFSNATDVTISSTNALLTVREADGTQCCITLTSATIGDCLQSDTSPKLGGNLDVNGNSIISASNGNIPITPNGTGIVIIDGLCHPIADGSAGQLLCTDGSAALKFATVAATSPAGSDTYVQFNNSSAFGGSANLTWDDTTLATTAFTATGNVSFDGGTFVFNDAGADKDFRIEGDSEANLFMVDASTDRIGIGTATPSHLLDVEGVANVATCIVTPKICVPTAGFSSGYTFPSTDGSAGTVMCTDGSGALAFATVSATSPAGSDTYIQFNNSSAFGGASGLTWDDTTFKASNICTAGTATLATATVTNTSASLTIKATGTGGEQANLYLIGDNAGDAGDGWLIRNPSNSLVFENDSAVSGTYVEKMRITSTGKVGIGTTAPLAPLDITSGYTEADPTLDASADDFVVRGGASTGLSIVSHNNGIATIAMGHRTVPLSSGIIVNNTTGDMNFRNNGGTKMMIDLVGKVGIGTTAPAGNLTVWNGDPSGGTPHADADEFVITSSSPNAGMSILPCHNGMASIKAGTCADNDYGVIQWNFGTGCFCIANNATNYIHMSYLGDINFCNNTAGAAGMAIRSESTTIPRGIAINFVNTTCVCQSSYFAYWYGGAGEKFIVMATGNVTNANNSYGAISDENRKQDITDARSYWDDFKGIRFRKFRFKKDVERDANTPELFGVVAQELETVFPGLIEENTDRAEQEVPSVDKDGNQTYTTNEEGEQVPDTESKLTDLDTTTKSVKYSVLSQIGLKVIQELQIRLEAAEAKIAVLEG